MAVLHDHEFFRRKFCLQHIFSVLLVSFYALNNNSHCSEAMFNITCSSVSSCSYPPVVEYDPSFNWIRVLLTERKFTSESYFNNMNTGNLTPVLSPESLGEPLSGFIQNTFPKLDATDISSLNSHASMLSISLIPSSFCRAYSVTLTT